MALATDVRDRIVACLAQASPPVVAAYLFGSAARGHTTPLSDVDIALLLDEPDRKKRVEPYRQLYVQLLDTLRGGVDGELDLVLLDEAPPALAYRIISGVLLYSANDRRRIERETAILCQYQDLLPLIDEQDRLLHERILRGLFGHRSPQMMDVQVVSQQLTYIEAALEGLREAQGFSLETLRADRRARESVLYELQTCIESMSDIANHIIASVGMRRPYDRSDAFTVLAEEGILSQEIANRFIMAAGMRNVLVHGYLGVDLEQVYRTLQKDLPDIEAFAQHIVAYLQRVRPEREAHG